jgi:hypothetical protein
MLDRNKTARRVFPGQLAPSIWPPSLGLRLGRGLFAVLRLGVAVLFLYYNDSQSEVNHVSSLVTIQNLVSNLLSSIPACDTIVL